jgi:hypothetical protein
MTSIRSRARVAGLLYLVMGIPGFFNFLFIPAAFIVPGDAAATARGITDRALTYRIGILSGLVGSIGFLFLALSLYGLFYDVDRTQARLLVSLVAVAVSIGVANLVNQLAPLVLLSGADFLSVFTRPQLDALAMAFLRLHGTGNQMAAAFWGLWLFPFGILVIRSRFIPRVLGVFLNLGGVAYLAISFTSLVFPADRQIVSRIALPFSAIGELPIALWLLVRGAAERPDEARQSEFA